MSGRVDVWHEQAAQHGATKVQKNKSFTAKKKKETIRAIKLYNQASWILGPTWLPHDTAGHRLCRKCGGGLKPECVCAFGGVLCPAAAGQDICWRESGGVRERESGCRS